MEFCPVGTVVHLRDCDAAGGWGHRTNGTGSYVTLSVAWIALELKLWLCGEKAVPNSLSRDGGR
jgi:hypothetical protein